MKKEKLTKEEALQHCVALWEWLAKNPSKDKEDWPEWKKNGGKFQARSYCFACEFSLQQKHNCCNDNCVLPCFASLCGCTETNSPYIHWFYSKNPDARIRNAKRIRDSAKAALTEISVN